MAAERYVTESPAETERLASTVASRLHAGDVVLLAGELGTGKTTFVRGAAKALGVQSRVTSPTFAIGNVYRSPSGEVAHVDLYRVDQLAVADEAALDDFLTPGRVAFVEWPHDELKRVPGLRAVVTMAHAGDDRREVSLEWYANGDRE